MGFLPAGLSAPQCACCLERPEEGIRPLDMELEPCVGAGNRTTEPPLYPASTIVSCFDLSSPNTLSSGWKAYRASQALIFSTLRLHLPVCKVSLLSSPGCDGLQLMFGELCKEFCPCALTMVTEQICTKWLTFGQCLAFSVDL